MKTYTKPEIKYEALINSDNISNGLSLWLEGNELTDKGVTTYTYMLES